MFSAVGFQSALKCFISLHRSEYNGAKSGSNEERTEISNGKRPDETKNDRYRSPGSAPLALSRCCEGGAMDTQHPIDYHSQEYRFADMARNGLIWAVSGLIALPRTICP